MSQNTGADERQAQASQNELLQRRKNARRTAMVLGGIVLVIFVAFLITGVTGRG